MPTLLRVAATSLLLIAFSPASATLTLYDTQELPTDGDVPESAVAIRYSVSVDGNTAVIGAPADTENGDFSGSVYVFTLERSEGPWTLKAKLFANDAAPFDHFGESVSISGDTILVGANADDDLGSLSGSAYVFIRDRNGSWSQQAKLLPSDGAAEGEFGWSVSLSGDTAVIGAFAASDFGGSAYVFSRDASGAWSEEAKLLPSDGGVQGLFGISVSISGDTAIVGASSEGAAYVFVRTGTGAWSEQAKLRPREPEFADQFGLSVSLSGDTAVVGSEAGAAFVFTRSRGGAWYQQAKLLGSDGDVFDGFGSAVSINGDVALIGSWDDRMNGGYVFTRKNNGVWREYAKVNAKDGSPLGAFSISGETVVTGTFRYREGPGSGSAFVFDVRETPTAAFLRCPGDVNGDEVADLVLVERGSGRLQVRDVRGVLVNQFTLDHSGATTAALVIPDTNGNGAPELVALAASVAEVRDLLTGGFLGTAEFHTDVDPTELKMISDRTGNGVPEIAALVADPMRVMVSDGLTGMPLNIVGHSSYLTGMDFLVYPDIDDNEAPELAVLGENRRYDGADKLELRDLATGSKIREIWLGKNWRVFDLVQISDLNANGSDDVAVLRVHPTGDVNVQIRDPVTRSWLGFVGFSSFYRPEALLAIPDINGNGADELAVFGRGGIRRNQKAVIKDSSTGERLQVLWFDREVVAEDFVSCGDMNGNGSTDLALVGRQSADSAPTAMIRDSRTGRLLARVVF